MIDNLYSTELGVFVNWNLIYVFFAVVIRRWSQTYLHLFTFGGKNRDLRCVKFVLLRQGYELMDFLQYW